MEPRTGVRVGGRQRAEKKPGAMFWPGKVRLYKMTTKEEDYMGPLLLQKKENSYRSPGIWIGDRTEMADTGEEGPGKKVPVVTKN